MKLGLFQHFGLSQNSISTFFEKKLGFHAVVPTHEDLSIEVSITAVGLALTKLGWFLFTGYGQTDTI